MATSKRSKHETKPEQAEGFKDGYVRSSHDHPKWRVGDAERSPLKVKGGMVASPDLTGRWMDKSFTYFLFINQVGDHLELMFALVESGYSGKQSDSPADEVRSATRLIRLGGTLEDGVVSLYLHHPDKPLDSTMLPCGELRAEGNWIDLDLVPVMAQGHYDRDKLAKLEEIATSRAGRLDHAPCLFEHHLHQPWASPELRTASWFPLTPIQYTSLPHFILDARVEVGAKYLLGGTTVLSYVDLVKAYFGLKVEEIGEDLSYLSRRRWQANVAQALDELVKRGYNDALLPPARDGGVDNFGRSDWRYWTLETLAKTSLEVPGIDDARSLYALTKIILDSEAGAGLTNFERYLHLVSAGAGHYYGANIEIFTVEGAPDKAVAKIEAQLKKAVKKGTKRLARGLMSRLPLGAMLGILEVRKEDDPELATGAGDEVPEWIGYYMVILGGVDLSIGASSGIGNEVSSAGQARNVYGQAWGPEQLEGRARLRDLGASAYLGFMGKGLGLTVLTLVGSGKGRPRTPLHINFSGLGDVMGLGGGGSISAKWFGGYAHHLSSATTIEDIGFGAEVETFEYGEHTATAPIHFPINGATPVDAARKLLEIFAACELSALSSERCELVFEGYADQPGDEIKNLILSRNRAISAYNYLKSVMGKRLKLGALEPVPSEKEEIKKYKQANTGDDDTQEEGADAKNKKEEFPIFDPSITSVKIVAHGEPPAESSKTSKESYDSSFRRVDVILNGSIELLLRRMDDGSGS